MLLLWLYLYILFSYVHFICQPKSSLKPTMISGNYAPLNTPVCSKPFVSTSETRETLLDVPLLITTSEEDDKKEKKTRNVS